MANSSLSSITYRCSNITYGSELSVAFISTRVVLLLPLSLLILSLGLRRRRRRRQGCSASSSHADVFALHLAVMELLFVLGLAVHFSGARLGLRWLELVGFYAACNILCGQTLFHVLTCVECYLAVVHPVTYRGLRRFWAVRIRDTGAGCVWLLCGCWTGLTAVYYPDLPAVPFYCLLASSLLVVSFCSLSVLCVLVRPGPSKRRAFDTILAVAAVLWLNVVGLLLSLALEKSGLLSYEDGCVVLTCGYIAALPSNLLLPLLFLQRAEELACCRGNG